MDQEKLKVLAKMKRRMKYVQEVGRSGYIYIPAEIRRKYRCRFVLIEDEGDRIVLHPFRVEEEEPPRPSGDPKCLNCEHENRRLRT